MLEEPQLRIFISGKEDELFNERIITIELIKSFECTPIASENRSASDNPIELEYLKEVRTSHIYIGIFGVKFSSATIQEFDEARKYVIPPLIFIRNLRDKEQREQPLIDFLNKVKEPSTGISYKSFNNVVELEKEIRKALSKLLAKRFTGYVDLIKENIDLKSQLREQLSATATVSDIIKLKQIEPLILPPKDIGIILSSEYGKAKITSFKIPEKVKRLEFFDVSASILGKTSHGFLDLVLVSPDGIHYWCPDMSSWSSITDNGNLFLNDEIYTGNIKCVIPDSSPPGVYRAIMGLYENDYKNRRCVYYIEKKLTVE
ncbi:MAG: DUF4062 domain-containing protein [Nitrosopumilaceae archaeon]